MLDKLSVALKALEKNDTPGFDETIYFLQCVSMRDHKR